MNAAVLFANSGRSGHLLPAHDSRRKVARERVRVGERSRRGVDVDHRHQSASSRKACTSAANSAVVLEQEAVRRVRVDREPRVRQEPGQQVRVARQDHRVAVAVGDEHRELDRGDSLEQRVVGDAPGAHGVVLRLAGLPRRRLVPVGRPSAEDAPGGLLARLAARARWGRRRRRCIPAGSVPAHRPRRSPPAPSRASPRHPAAPTTRARHAAAGRGG